MKTFQELFNTAYRGLASQGFNRSISHRVTETGGEADTCAYRGDAGRRCAVGWLMPDEHYNAAFEGSGIRLAEQGSHYEQLLERILDAIDAPHTEESVHFLASLQGCHDSARNAEDCKAALIEFANAYNLTLPALEMEDA